MNKGMKKIITVALLLAFLSACTATVRESEDGAAAMDTVTETAKTEAELKTDGPTVAVTSQPEPVYNTLSTADSPLPLDFIRYGAPCWFNDYEVVTAENNPGAIGAAGLTTENKFAWREFDDGSGSYCLMILVDTVNDGGANLSLFIPKYGAPSIGRVRYNIYITWENPADPNDTIELMFEEENNLMRINSNAPKGVSQSSKTAAVEIPVSVYDDGSSSKRFFVPLYAILNEVGGGVMYDPFGGDTTYIYTGEALQGCTGFWETSDRGEYRTDAVIGGVTYSIASYWTGLELRADGTFLESDRYWQDGGEWVLTESKGRYSFFGRVLVMLYETESEYRGGDYTALIPCRIDEPTEGWGKVAGACLYVRYIEDWDEDYLDIHGRNPMYAGLTEHGDAAPRPGKAGVNGTNGVFSGILQKDSFYHDGRDEWIDYCYIEIGEEQFAMLVTELGGDYYNSGEDPENEIQLYAADESIRLSDYVGQMVQFKGFFFAVETVYHRRDIVFGVKEIYLDGGDVNNAGR